jgi:hypothetical protein
MATAISRLTQPYSLQIGDPMNLRGGIATPIYRNKRILESSAAEVVKKVTGESVTVNGSNVGTLANRFAIKGAYADQLGDLYNGGNPATAPVVKVAGVTQNSGYAVAVDPFSGTSTVTFTAAPSGAVTVDYFYRQQNIFLVDLSTLGMKVLRELSYQPLPDPADYDQKLFRVKAYELLAVEAEIGNAVALNVYGG